MRRITRTFPLVLVLAVLATGQPPAKTKLDDAVTIEFPKDGYAFTLAEAAKGVKFDYKIVVSEDVAGVVAMPFGPSFHEPAGPSGLHPRERIAGDGQVYCLMDFGLAPPREAKGPGKTLKKGTYAHAFDWDGRNWTGPSDFGNPKGKAFPAGTYDVSVTIHGKLVTEKGLVPYEVTRKAKLVLK